METTICPWCHTEIVWDEELGPEEECPHCNNELKGYRTLNISIGSVDEEDVEDQYIDDEHDYNDDLSQGLWGEDETDHLGAIRRVETFTEAGGDLLAYESAVEQILDEQDEVPECPQCREYMLYAGSEPVNEGFVPVLSKKLNQSLINPGAKLNVYVCSACFSVSRFLSENDRISFIRTISDQGDLKGEA